MALRAVALALGLCVPAATAAASDPGCDPAGLAQGPCYTQPTTRYDHAVLGDAVEWGAIAFRRPGGGWRAMALPPDLVFEDTHPRLADLDGDGDPEAITVESHLARGSRLAVWDETGRVAATAFIGKRHRWLAPLGAADLDGDGRIEIAYVEMPHRAMVLKVVRLEGRRIVPVAERAGLTNHRIGEPFIQGGIALCDGLPTILTADAGWTRVIATRLADGRLKSHDAGPYAGPASLRCRPGCSAPGEGAVSC